MKVVGRRVRAGGADLRHEPNCTDYRKNVVFGGSVPGYLYLFIYILRGTLMTREKSFVMYMLCGHNIV